MIAARHRSRLELPDGRLKLIDGPLRRDLDPDMEVDWKSSTSARRFGVQGARGVSRGRFVLNIGGSYNKGLPTRSLSNTTGAVAERLERGGLRWSGWRSF